MFAYPPVGGRSIGSMPELTPTATRRERKREQTRVDLVRAAVKLFEARGYEATTVDDIAEEADYGRATFFRHFPTKEDVAFLDLPSRVSALQEVDLAPPEADLWQAARAVVTAQVLGFTADAPELEAACLRLWFTEPALHRRYLELVVQAEEHLARFFMQRAGDDPETTVLCRALATAVIGVGRAIVRGELTDEATVRKALDAGFAMIERGTLIDSLRATPQV
jgi:AcrR family transcriptional regulator